MTKKTEKVPFKQIKSLKTSKQVKLHNFNKIVSICVITELMQPIETEPILTLCLWGIHLVYKKDFETHTTKTINNFQQKFGILILMLISLNL